MTSARDRGVIARLIAVGNEKLHDMRAVLVQKRIARRRKIPLTVVKTLEAAYCLRSLVRLAMDSYD